MESLLTIADNLEPCLRRINMQHRRKTKKLTLFDQIILRFKLEASYSDDYNLPLPVSLVIIIKKIIIIVPGNINIHELQKITLLSTAHLLRRVLSIKQKLSLPPKVHGLESEVERENQSQLHQYILYNNNNNNNNNYKWFSSNLKGETEGLLVAVQDQAINTRSYQNVICGQQVESKCVRNMKRQWTILYLGVRYQPKQSTSPGTIMLQHIHCSIGASVKIMISRLQTDGTTTTT